MMIKTGLKLMTKTKRMMKVRKTMRRVKKLVWSSLIKRKVRKKAKPILLKNLLPMEP